ncbi:hypothetical protein [Corynebacterium nasicanis]|uniref:Beta-carotene 15,15'-monooxygenase n=1 Tax=Corynebacterium nasicanis TaxID=1448267 RepID=A0ABW1Q9P9_9CORY
MTTPNEPHEEPENSYPAYPSTPHPEDAPTYGQQPYQGYAGYSEQTPAATTTTTGTGKVRPMEAVSWAFGTTFRNWPVWILGTLALLVASVVVAMTVDFAFGGFSGDMSYQNGLGYQVSQVLLGLLFSALTVFIYHGALRQVDKAKIGYGDFGGNVNFWPTFGVFIVIQVITTVLFSAFALPIMLSSNDLANSQMATQDEMLAELSKLFGVFAVIMVVAVLVTPLTMFMVWFAADRRTGFAGAFGAGFRAGARNHLTLLLFNIVAGLAAMIVSLITLGLALIIIGPALLLAQAHMYRQAAQGALPAPTRA